MLSPSPSSSGAPPGGTPGSGEPAAAPGTGGAAPGAAPAGQAGLNPFPGHHRRLPHRRRRRLNRRGIHNLRIRQARPEKSIPTRRSKHNRRKIHTECRSHAAKPIWSAGYSAAKSIRNPGRCAAGSSFKSRLSTGRDLDTVKTSELITTTAGNRLTGKLEIRGEESVGAIFFVNGLATHATTPNAYGDSAIRDLSPGKKALIRSRPTLPAI